MIVEIFCSIIQIGFGANALYNSNAFPRLVALPEASIKLDLSVMLPMRDEIKNCDRIIRELLAAKEYFREIVICDDGSTDGTRQVLDDLASAFPSVIRVIEGKPKPSEWKGKVWTLDQLVAATRSRYLLLVDSDVMITVEGIKRLVLNFANDPVEHSTLFPRQRTPGATDLLVNHIFTTLLLFLPVHLVPDSRYPSAVAGCGQVQIVDRVALKQLGGYNALATSLHDGLTLARKMKRAGKRVRCAFAGDLFRCTMYDSFSEAWRGFTRNANEANGSVLSLTLISMFLVILFIVGPIFALLGQRLWPMSLLSSIFFFFAYALAMFRFGSSRTWIFRAPISIVLMTVLQYVSFARHAFGITTNWKGREV